MRSSLAFATLCVAGVRLWITLGEHMTLLGTSRGEATTDPLTGLRNRRALANDLAEQMADASPQRPLLLLLFDLNGFKAYNDTYGHPAGDALLTRLGTRLTRSRRRAGQRLPHGRRRVLRAHGGAGRPARRARGAHTRGAERDAATASRSPRRSAAPRSTRPTAIPTTALLAADRRMYAEKNGRRGSAGGQSAAVLLRVLTERHPDLGEHVDSVAALTEQGRRASST